ncbi:mating type 1-1-3 protein [Fusarium austroafricanum]|uniref:Mating type 1-1-3 protein n=1 Tax=Fusarium austroafricanum TaxID=2364996 RepID=A0A8H4JG13_9HYPO|nr:mating type 1-1-3 protein [Fusarium austroafricanum]
MPEGSNNGLIEGPLGVLMPPEAEVPLIFVYSRTQADVHIFVPENASMTFTNHVADNFSRRVQQPVRVFHDKERGKYRLCPIPEDSCPDTSTYGRFCFTRGMARPNTIDGCRSNAYEDQSTPVKVSNVDPTVGEAGHRIPRPRNCWLLYRQAKSQEITTRNEGITASELSSIISRMWDEETPETQAYWHRLADQEEHSHSRRYPGYKYSPTKESGQELS